MNRYLRIITAIVVLLTVENTVAQNEFDVLRYSNIEHFGDARFNAMGGSFGALGANMSSLSINPGGLGVYNSSDFSFTPAFHLNATESKSSSNNMGTDGKLNFHIGNIGLVGTFNASNGWRNVNITIGYNRISNFNSAISINGKTDNSFLGTYANEINTAGISAGSDIANSFPFSANLGYQTYLINPMVTDSTKFDHVFKDSKNIKQITNIETKGGMGETYFGIGGNFENKLYIGAIMGVTTVRYEFNRMYKETAEESDTLTEFKSFTVNDFVKTSGSGVNLKLGLIYSMTDWFRFGLAFHTPTYYSLSDNWDTRVTSEDKLGDKLVERSPLGTFDYVVTTPYRFITSGAFIVNDHGVINVDYEIVDYSTARIRQDNNFGGGADFTIENQNIKTNFQTAHNIRVGTEWRLDPFRFRAGYRLMGDPIKSSFNTDNSSNIYSFGIGIKQEGYYFDVAYLLKTYQTQVPIVADYNDFASVNLNDHYLTFTLGFRF